MSIFLKKRMENLFFFTIFYNEKIENLLQDVSEKSENHSRFRGGDISDLCKMMGIVCADLWKKEE